MEFSIGPVWVIVVETNPGEFEYLVFSHAEFKNFVTNNARHYTTEEGYEPHYEFTVPKWLENTPFESFLSKWWKIEKNAKLYVK
jgi:hypothetical protein